MTTAAFPEIRRGGAEPGPATIECPLLLHASHEVDAPFEFTLVTGAGPTNITGRPLQTGALSIAGANEWVPGKHPKAHTALMESMVRMDWDGETGWGYMERSDPSGGTRA